MSKFWFGMVLLVGAGCGSAVADTLKPGSFAEASAGSLGMRGGALAVSGKTSSDRGAMYQSPAGDHQDSVQLLLMGLGLCGASGLCVYRASRLKRTGLAVCAE